MAEPQPTIIRYERPTELKRDKTIKLLVRDDHMIAAVQILKEGGENNLHSHKDQDGLWFVLGGKAKFYTTGDELLGEFGQGEGIFIPRNYPYWFESSGDEPLEILQAESWDKSVLGGDDPLAGRVNHQPLKSTQGPADVQGAWSAR